MFDKGSSLENQRLNPRQRTIIRIYVVSKATAVSLQGNAQDIFCREKMVGENLSWKRLSLTTNDKMHDLIAESCLVDR